MSTTHSTTSTSSPLLTHVQNLPWQCSGGGLVIATSDAQLETSWFVLAAASPLFRDALLGLRDVDDAALSLPDFSSSSVRSALALIHRGEVVTETEAAVSEELLQLLKLMGIKLTSMSFVVVDKYDDLVLVDENNNNNNVGSPQCPSVCSRDSNNNNVNEKSIIGHECVVCRRRFANRNNLLRHVSLKHGSVGGGNNNFSCSKCNMSFTHYDDLTAHRLFHRKTVRGHSCSHCGRTFPTYGRMYDHKLKHLPPDHPDKPRCLRCGKVFANKASLRHHLVAIHLRPADKGGGYECNRCGKAFSFKWNLQQHLRLKHRRWGEELKEQQQPQQQQQQHQVVDVLANGPVLDGLNHSLVM